MYLIRIKLIISLLAAIVVSGQNLRGDNQDALLSTQVDE